MPRYPGAIWDPISLTGGGTNGPMHAYLGLVLHVNDAQSYNLHDYFDNGHNNVSAHFQCAYDGKLWQYIDTSLSSWCQSDGNDTYLSLETEGFPTEPLTAAQLSSIVGLYKWVNGVHRIPFQLANVVGEMGFAWHGMGGVAWGNHPGCPGELRKAQRQTILDRAQLQLPPIDKDVEMRSYLLRDGSDNHWVIAPDLSSKILVSDGAYTKLAASGDFDTSNPGIDQTTLTHIPDVTNT
jgi:hypothetical protein